MQKLLALLKQNKLVALIVAISLLIRLYFNSSWLEDWDSVQYSIAITDYDIGKNQPHAPGYPLYIALAQLLYIFTKDQLLSLNLLSIMAGTGCVLLIYLIARHLFNRNVAVLSSIIFAVTPLALMMSVVPLTNIVGLCSFLTVIYLLVTHFEKAPILVSLAAGFILGFRATELPLLLCLLGISIFKSKKIRQIPYIGISFATGILLWVIPMVIATGIESFITAYTWIASYVIKHDSVVAQDLAIRLNQINFLLKTSFTPVLILLTFVSLLFNRYKKSYVAIFLYTWILGYFIPLIFIYNLEVPRYALPLLPPITIVTAYFLIRITKKWKMVGYAFTITLIVSLSAQSLSQLIRYNRSIPPSIAPILYVKQNYNPKETFIIASYIFRQFQFYAPQFPSVYEQEITSEVLTNKKYVIVDYIGLEDKLPDELDYTIAKKITFQGDRDIYSRLSKVNLFVLELKHGK